MVDIEGRLHDAAAGGEAVSLARSVWRCARGRRSDRSLVSKPQVACGCAAGALSRNSPRLDHAPTRIPAYCVLSLKVTVMFNMEHAHPRQDNGRWRTCLLRSVIIVYIRNVTHVDSHACNAMHLSHIFGQLMFKCFVSSLILCCFNLDVSYFDTSETVLI